MAWTLFNNTIKSIQIETLNVFHSKIKIQMKMSVQLSLYMSRRYDCCQGQFEKNMKPVSILFKQQFLVKHRVVQKQYTPYSPNLVPCNFFFLELKIHLNRMIWGREQYWRKYDLAALHHFKRVNFRSVLMKEKLAGISVLNAKGTTLKKMNVPFIVNFCLVKYSFSLDTF